MDTSSRTILLASQKPSKHVHVSPDDPQFAWYVVIIIVLVLLGGVYSGLTLGLMGLDTVNLQVLSASGTDAERRQAPRVLRLLRTGRHTILVVLLLGNTLVNTSLPIFIDSLVGGGWIAVLGSTALELIFGECVSPLPCAASSADARRSRIIPQSVCNRYGLAIGSTFAPVVRIFVLLMYPIAKPIGMVLDRFLGAGEEGITYRKAELKTFVSLGVEDTLGEDEVALLGSVLEFSGKTVEDVMTPLEDVFAISERKIVDDELVAEILRKGHSRIPVHEYDSPGAFIGCLTLRALVEYNPTDLEPASKLVTQRLPQCPPDLPLLEALTYFQSGWSHILLVTENPGSDTGAMGVVTLEDVVEELIGGEIIDETDLYVDIHSRVPVVRRKIRSDQPGLKRIFEGRLARRRHVLDHQDKRGTENLIDHPSNA